MTTPELSYHVFLFQWQAAYMPGNSHMLHSGSFAPPWSSYFLQLIPVLQITQAWNHSHFYSIFSHHRIEPITFYDKDLYRSFLHKVSHIRPFLSRSPFPPNSSPITSSLKTTTVSSLGPHLQLQSKIALRPGCPQRSPGSPANLTMSPPCLSWLDRDVPNASHWTALASVSLLCN